MLGFIQHGLRGSFCARHKHLLPLGHTARLWPSVGLCCPQMLRKAGLRWRSWCLLPGAFTAVFLGTQNSSQAPPRSPPATPPCRAGTETHHLRAEPPQSWPPLSQSHSCMAPRGQCGPQCGPLGLSRRGCCREHALLGKGLLHRVWRNRALWGPPRGTLGGCCPGRLCPPQSSTGYLGLYSHPS